MLLVSNSKPLVRRGLMSVWKLEVLKVNLNVFHIPCCLHKVLDRLILGQNVCDRVDVPREVPYEIHPFTVEQAQRFLEAIQGHPNEALFILAITTGMRRGEIAGLKWHDIDMEHAALHVQRALIRMPT